MHNVKSDNNNVHITYEDNSVTFQDHIIAKTITCEWSMTINSYSDNLNSFGHKK